MALSTISGLLLATPFAATLLPLTVELIPLICAGEAHRRLSDWAHHTDHYPPIRMRSAKLTS